VAIERVPPRRAAGAGLALPVFNKECASTINLFPSEARRDFSRLSLCFGFVLVRLSAGLSGEASRSGFPYPFGASGNYATLSGFVSFGFLVLWFSFFVSHLLHYLCVKVGAFLSGNLASFFFLDLGRGDLRNTFEGGARVWCFLGVLAFGVLSCILFLWVERPIRLARLLCDNRTRKVKK
jgi:hypothetical protein